MILEIALGIVLAVVILALLPAILAFGIIALGILLVLGALGLAWALASNASWSQDDLVALTIFAVIALAVVGLAKGASFVERRTSKRVLEGEFLCFAVFGPVAAFFLFSVGEGLSGAASSDELFARLLGFASACLPMLWAGWRIRRRRP